MASVSPADAALGLVVPVDVAALCVGEVDAVEATKNMAGATTRYDEQVTQTQRAFLGSHVTIDLDAPPWHQLEEGVHLHWALPDALTRASTEGGSLLFAPAPNRWLVTRVLADGRNPQTRAWLVESDAVLERPPAGQAPVTLPVKPGVFKGQNYGWLGRAHDAPEAFTLDAIEPASSILDAAGVELTAVSSGDIAFAAYYPNSRSVFGFRDALTDVSPAKGSSAALTYTVFGWYEDASKDPIAPGATRASIEERFGWTYAASGAPSFSVYEGFVEGIEWNRQTRYLPDEGPPVDAHAAIGQTPAEALSAYFTKLDHPEIPLFEKLLDAFQLGLIDGFAQPKPDQLTILDEDLHDRGFARAEAGSIYTVAVPDPGAESGGARELVNLPPALAADLNRLNDVREQRDRCLDHVAWYRWQTFADWYRVFVANEETQNDAETVAYERVGGWEELAGECAALEAALATQRAQVEAQLPAPMTLIEVPGSPYVHPADPVVMLTGEQLGFPRRYGGDGRYDDKGRLVCRLSAELLSAIAAGGTTVDASSFAVATPSGLPHSEIATALLRETCLLDTALLAALTNVSAASLDAALPVALEGHRQSVVTLSGSPPSPVAATWFASGAWLPMFLSWSVSYLPFHPTQSGDQPAPYPPGTVNDGFTLDQDAGGALTPNAGTGPNPAQPSFPQSYSAYATLTPTAADTLRTRLEAYLEDHHDGSLEAILDQLCASHFLTAPLAGLTDLMSMRRHGLQLQVRVPADAPQTILELTTAAADVVASANDVGPAFNRAFNPLRAGYMRVRMELVDVYGQRRKLDYPELICSAPLVATGPQGPVASTAYLAPRLAQPSRLVLRWLAADGSGLDEMNAHPATTPVCGWLAPNRLDGSLFVYSAEGGALGTLFLRHTSHGEEVRWQSAPGEDRTIDEDIERALQDANVRLRELATALRDGSAEFFKALWRVLDTVADTVEAGTPSSNTSLAALVGHPVAVAEAMIRVELQGAPRIDLGWQAFRTDTDAGTTGVELPVVLGDLTRLSDGLIGYFGPVVDSPYDYRRFYSQAAEAGSHSGVVRPDQSTITLTAAPGVDPAEPPDLAAATRTVLMLLDPMAPVHATTGLFPTASLQLPPDFVADALSTLDMSFFTAPVLRPRADFTLPTPSQSGYAISWIEELRTESPQRIWDVTPEVGPSTVNGIWEYTPQTLTEGWLRLNPLVLEFELLDAQGRPAVHPGPGNELTLKLSNSGRREATFRPGPPSAEGIVSDGSTFYIHLGALVAPADIPAVQLAGTGWTFRLFSEPRYGPYWAAAPQAPVSIAPGGQVTFAVSNLTATEAPGRARVAFDYYRVDGTDDGVYVQTVAVQTAPANAR